MIESVNPGRQGFHSKWIQPDREERAGWNTLLSLAAGRKWQNFQGVSHPSQRKVFAVINRNSRNKRAFCVVAGSLLRWAGKAGCCVRQVCQPLSWHDRPLPAFPRHEFVTLSWDVTCKTRRNTGWRQLADSEAQFLGGAGRWRDSDYWLPGQRFLTQDLFHKGFVRQRLNLAITVADRGTRWTGVRNGYENGQEVV